MNDKKDMENTLNERDADGMLPFYPTCRFCGSAELPVGDYESQEEANEAATIRCKCYEARRYQEELKKKREREKNIVKLRQKLDDFSTYCESRGVNLEGDLYDTIFNAGVAVLDGVVLTVSFKFARMKVAISANSKGTLIIAFTYSDGAKVEV